MSTCEIQLMMTRMRRAIVNLGEDMSFLGMRIATLADEMDRSSAAIGWLKEQVALLSRSAGALGELGKRANHSEVRALPR